MRKAKRMLALVLSMIMAFSMATTAFAADRDAKTIIADMINYYQYYQDEAAIDIERLNEELTAVDATQGEAWGIIMDYWSWVNTEMVVNRDVLPDGLPTDNSLCITVLGFQLNPDGTMKDELVGRLQVALDSAKKYPNAYVACTGGGTASENPDATEADQMAAWLIEQGLDPARIIVENQSKSTVQNAQFTYAILRSEYPQIESLALVTSDYHIPRGCALYNSKLILSAYEAGDKLLTIVNNAGFAAGHEGYESISLQASGVAQVAGVSLRGLPQNPPLSVLTGIKAEGEASYTVGDELGVTVKAVYDTGYEKDVTAEAVITGYDANKTGKQTIKAEYNGFEATYDIEVKVDTSAIIADMINYYKYYQDEAAVDIERLLAELSAADAKQGEAWEMIMDYWSWVNTEMVVNRDVLPDGLPTDNSLCITVLGFQLNPDGTMKDELIGRLQVALDSAKKYPNAYVACTGGGTASENPNATEADQMAAWLIEQGLDPARIIVENQSKSTVQNAQFTYAILRSEYPQIQSLALVTSDYHIPRGCVLYNSKLILSAYEAGDKLLTIVNNAGYAAGHEGYESISLQVNGVAQVAGISLRGLPENPPLSVLTGIKAEGKASYSAGQKLAITVKAIYDTGFERDVTEECDITGYNANKAGKQTVQIEYDGFKTTYDVQVNAQSSSSSSSQTSTTPTSPATGYELPVVPMMITAVALAMVMVLKKKEEN